MYGITETTVHVTYRPITMADVEAETGSVIGVPIPDLAVYLLDRYGKLVPVGVPGELYVGGGGVGRGYLNRPELTAARFVPDPFTGTPGARLYRSGDLARRLPDGDLEYLGRLDHQVKIRGFRIELGEIEAALAQHPAVREVVALVREDRPGDRRLVAYIRTDGHPTALAAELRAHAKERLPEYMVPAAIVALDALPLTGNGKVDRAALPAPEAGEAHPDEGSRAPATPEEMLLARIWSEVLRVDTVGVDENFFELGWRFHPEHPGHRAGASGRPPNLPEADVRASDGGGAGPGCRARWRDSARRRAGDRSSSPHAHPALVLRA